MFLSTNFNANNDTPLLSHGGAANVSFITAPFLFTAFAGGISLVAVFFFYGAT
ncbi:hypothetical protein RYX36_014452, partial [Vicia faba]